MAALAVLTIYFDVAEVPSDVVTVEVLALLQLAAKRRRCRIQLCNASPDLLELLVVMGLNEVLPA